MGGSRSLASLIARCYPASIDRDACARFVEEALTDRRRSRLARARLVVTLVGDVIATRRGRAALAITTTAGTIGHDAAFQRSRMMDRTLSDIRYAFRVLKRSPGYTSIVLLVLTLGIGATTAVYAVVDAVMLRPFPYRDMNRIMILTERTQDGQEISVSWPNFLDWRASNDVFEELGLYRGAAVTMTGEGAAERLSGAMVSSSVFATMGVAPLSGRVFNEEDDKPGPGQVVLISERLWQSRFGSVPDIVGKELMFGNTPFTVVGVMPAAMRFPSRTSDVWLPLGGSIATFPPSRASHPGLTAVGRLKQTVTFEQARAAMDALGDRLAQQYPDANATNRIGMTPYYESIVRNIRPTLFVVLAAVGLLLLIACVNVAGLMLARAERRHQELVVRAALGAARGRLVRQLLAEAFLLALTGGLAGILLAFLVLRAFVASEPATIPRVDLLGMDWRVASFALATSLVTMVVFGLLPALRSASPDLRGALQHLRTGAGRRSVRLRRAVVAAQIGIAVVLLVGAGLLGRTIGALMSIDLGFAPKKVSTGRVALTGPAYATLGAWTSFHQTLLERLRTIPGVVAVGLNSGVPLEGGAAESSIRKEGDPRPAPTQSPLMSMFQSASPGYFDTMGIQLVRGRFFNDGDRDGSVPVAVVDETLAARMFPGEDPIGRRVTFEQRPPPEEDVLREIVGVVRHVKHYGLTSDRAYVQIYVPYTQLPIYFRERRPTMAMFVKTSGDPESIVPAMREKIRELDPKLALYGVRTMEQHVDRVTEQPRLSSALLGGFAAVAMTLAVVGIYGVLAYSVSQRTREIGVRVALGAGRAQIVRGVLREGAVLSLIGLALGLIAAVPAGRYLEALLYQVTPGDPTTFAVAAGVVFVAAMVATWLPARRASAVQPVVALRGE